MSNGPRDSNQDFAEIHLVYLEEMTLVQGPN